MYIENVGIKKELLSYLMYLCGDNKYCCLMKILIRANILGRSQSYEANTASVSNVYQYNPNYGRRLSKSGHSYS